MSTTSTMMIDKSQQAGRGKGWTPVSLGYDGIRFVAPVLHRRHDHGHLSDRFARTGTKSFGRADIAITNQHGETVACGQTHFEMG